MSTGPSTNSPVAGSADALGPAVLRAASVLPPPPMPPPSPSPCPRPSPAPSPPPPPPSPPPLGSFVAPQDASIVQVAPPTTATTASSIPTAAAVPAAAAVTTAATARQVPTAASAATGGLAATAERTASAKPTATLVGTEAPTVAAAQLPRRVATPTDSARGAGHGLPSYWFSCLVLAALGVYFRRPLSVCVARVRRLPELVARLRGRFEAQSEELQTLTSSSPRNGGGSPTGESPRTGSASSVIRGTPSTNGGGTFGNRRSNSFGGFTGTSPSPVVERAPVAAAAELEASPGGVIAAEMATDGWGHDLEGAGDGWDDNWGDDDGWNDAEASSPKRPPQAV